MSGSVNVTIEAEDIVDTMIDDGCFAAEMWEEIGKGLNRGRLLDDAVDIIKQFDKPLRQSIVGSLYLMVESLDPDREVRGDK